MTARSWARSCRDSGRWYVPSRWLLVAATILAAEACAESPAPAVPTRSRHATTDPAPGKDSTEQFTFSPQPDPPPNARKLVCGLSDVGLRRAAQSTLEQYVRTARIPSSESFEFALRSAGVPYVWVRSWAATAPTLEAIEDAWAAWAKTLPDAATRRCGLAVSTDSDSVHALSLVADVLADVSPIPRTGHVGQWLTFEAQLHIDATAVALLALGPRGAPYKVPTQLSPTGLVHARIPLAAPGRWLFQLLPTAADGPRPVAEVEVFVDIPLPRSPDQQLVAGDRPECETGCGAEQLLPMLNQARASEKLPPLRREPHLDALASEHAEAMSAKGRLAHDVGDGDAYIRVSADFPDASLIGENIAHASSVRGAHRALWLSPAHRQNLLRREYGVVGIGVARGADGDVWVCQLFAAQSTPSATY